MSNTFFIKKDTTVPSIAATLEDSKGDAIDLSQTSEVKFIMAPLSGGQPKVDASANVTDASNGVVQYDWQSSDTDTAGFYLCEWEITYSVGGTEKVPSTDHTYVHILEDL
jgi:hypothetical protein